jgi:Carboxypeptidase regulatory-like domain
MKSRRRVNSDVMRLLLTSACLLLIAAFAPHRHVHAMSPFAAQRGYGIFRGVIVDIKGKRIRGARVNVAGRDVTQEIKPNRFGYFEMTMPAGTYEITVTRQGFARYKLTNLEVTGNGESSHLFRLESSRLQSSIRRLWCLWCDA